MLNVDGILTIVLDHRPSSAPLTVDKKTIPIGQQSQISKYLDHELHVRIPQRQPYQRGDIHPGAW
jgi:hypothetical protein